MKLSVTSVILPDLDLVETCGLLQKLGYDGLELRVRYTPPSAVGKGYSNWGEHKTDISPANLANRADEVTGIAADPVVDGQAVDFRSKICIRRQPNIKNIQLTIYRFIMNI